MTSLVKAPEVLGAFYPADPGVLAASVDAHLAAARRLSLRPKAVVAPHAGHVFSGPVAATAYAMLADRRGAIGRVILLGPTHRMAVPGLAAHPAEAWATPLGVLPVDRRALALLFELPYVMEHPAPFAGEHGLEVHLPFIQRALGRVEIVPLLVGGASQEEVATVLRLLWGGPETAIVISSDLSHYLPYEAAREKDIATVSAVERLRADRIGREDACGRHGLYGLLNRAQRLDMRATCVDYRNSGDTRGDKARVVGYASFAFEYAAEARVPAEDRKLLLDIARYVVRFGIEKGRRPVIKWGGLSPCLTAQRASFVTLTLDGNLRGCIGSLVAHRRLCDDVVDSAWKAAFGDPRFKPLTARELERVEIDISILSHARPVPAASEDELLTALDPDRDGLILRDGDRQALFLPHVWAGIPDPRLFVHQLKRKAGLAPEHWTSTLRAFRFGVEAFGEKTAA